jgi:GMP synthase-like glutamine amidotransferase
LLAAACGGRVVSNRWEELGAMSVFLTGAGKEDKLFAGLPESFETFQWHHDSFDLPPAAELLASSDDCVHQAFRVGDNAWGTQFHPEVTEAIIRNWCAWDSDDRERADVLVADWQSLVEYGAVSRRLLENFIGTDHK